MSRRTFIDDLAALEMAESGIDQGDPLTPEDTVDILAAAAADGQRRCRRCGCTDARACPGGCWWVEPGLCSRCAR